MKLTAAEIQSQKTIQTESRLWTENITIKYDNRVISRNLSVQIPDGSFTVIVGPNGCGKSTLLRTLSNLLKPSEGQILLDGKAITSYKSKEVARKLGLLPQSSTAPDGITVANLIAHGRYPYQSLIRQWTDEDEAAVISAMELTNTSDLSHRYVDELSGGQRQRVWVAMVLAQQTPMLLLDEPTTYLDIAHQIELLELFKDLNQQGNTLVAVLHDLNHAARYADNIIAMKDGQVIAQGDPREIITAKLVEEVFGLKCIIIDDPVANTPLVVPLGKG
ncbi:MULTISPECIES: ABC transporter ATP-binding protein [Gottfriedia]|jgi:iron complex transport system ATP-binding protein|uniref:Iron-dicitrate transporter ATP-binding subunit n=1 Tax=Gottfriedia luciferensis TaxID=178774 RepID=A0ABX2ZNZ9_9BACI|nr:ABC transporter ATP-binding protein [Gottfriedia luciferensis]ODG90460.1 iron-dicitrate transporter ATP-binding subunit [Gottfriedia luciferensis]